MRFPEIEGDIRYLVRHVFRKFVGTVEQTTRFDFEGETEISRTSDIEPILGWEDIPEMMWYDLGVMVKQRHLPLVAAYRFESLFNGIIEDFFGRLQEPLTQKEYDVLLTLESFKDDMGLQKLHENKPRRTVCDLVEYLSCEVDDDDILFAIDELAPPLTVRMAHSKGDEKPEAFAVKGMVFFDKASVREGEKEELVLRSFIEVKATDDEGTPATFLAEVIIFDNTMIPDLNLERFYAENPEMIQPSTPDIIKQAETTTEDF